MKLYRFIPHPEDSVEVDVFFGGKFNELSIYINDEADEPFVTQVNERLTVEDDYLVLFDEFVRKPRKWYIHAGL